MISLVVEIKIVIENKKQFVDLLLLADEQESMIDKYLERGELFALYDEVDYDNDDNDDANDDGDNDNDSHDDLKSICVVTRESPDTCELKNIATYEKWQGRGYASKLIQHISSFYKGKYKTMLVGTGEAPSIIRFYEKNGFALSHRKHNFFIDNYDHPIFEEGIQLVDMVYLKKEL